MKSIYVVVTDYFPHMYFGSYSSILSARKAIENFFSNSCTFTSCEDCENYRYVITTNGNEHYWAEIVFDVIEN